MTGCGLNGWNLISSSDVEVIFFHCSMHNRSVAQPRSFIVIISLRVNMAKAWSWPLASIYSWDQECVKLNLHVLFFLLHDVVFQNQGLLFIRRSCISYWYLCSVALAIVIFNNKNTPEVMIAVLSWKILCCSWKQNNNVVWKYQYRFFLCSSVVLHVFVSK